MWVISILNRTAVFKNSQFKIQTFQNLCLTGGSAFAFTSIDFTPSNTRFNVCPTSKIDQTFSACRAITQLPVTPGEEKDYLSIDQLAHKLTACLHLRQLMHIFGSCICASRLVHVLRGKLDPILIIDESGKRTKY